MVILKIIPSRKFALESALEVCSAKVQRFAALIGCEFKTSAIAIFN